MSVLFASLQVELVAEFSLKAVSWLLQTDINDKMRAILIDWLVEVHLKFKVRPC